MKRILQNKRIVLLILFTISLFAACCMYTINQINSYAYAANYPEQLSEHDEKILSYYHDATLQEEFVDNKVVVILKSSYSNLKEIGFEDFAIVEQVAPISSIVYDLKQINRESGEKLSLKKEENQIITLELAVHDKGKVLEAIDQLKKLDMVLVAQPSYIYEVISSGTSTVVDYNLQWGLSKSGICAKDAWDNYTVGDVNIKVGIMEDGIDLNHEDLQGRVFNGNFTPQTDASLSHGTHVAGIIGARTDNNFGIAGVAQVSMYLLNKAADQFVNSLAYAEQNDIKIINASFFYALIDKDANTYDYASYDATHFAALSKYSGLFIAAACNENNNNDTYSPYPASYDLSNIISVGAINNNGSKSSYSNYGQTSVDLFAPGDGIYSTLPNNSYGNDSGTSMAAPFVTGVAALIKSYLPELPAPEIKQFIMNNVDKSNNLTNLCVSGGRLNAYKALNALANVPDHHTYIRYRVNTRKPFTNGINDGLADWGVPYTIADGSTYGVEGYDFVGWSLTPGTFVDGEGTTGAAIAYTAGQKVTYLSTQRDFFLYAVWKPKSWTIVEYQNDEFIAEHEMHYDGPSMTFSAPNIAGFNFVEWRKQYNNTPNYTFVSSDKTITLNPNDNMPPQGWSFYFLAAVYEQACIEEGSLITLADGSQRAVEDLIGNENLLVWNLYTGSYDVAPIMFIDSHSPATYNVTTLTFSDGTEVNVIDEHAFWDVGLNKYVYLRSDADKYIGHTFKKSANRSLKNVELVGVENYEKQTVAYSPVTYGHLCYFVNGMLSMPGGIDGLFNIFEVDGETMTYNAEAMAADIEEYGLYTYEEFCEVAPVTEEAFEAFNGQYLKVAIGKGLITADRLYELAERYGMLK